MSRRTSIEAYSKIKENGLLSQLRFEVYDTLFQDGPLTAGECWHWFHKKRQRSSISARMSELERMGVVYQVGVRICEYTGNKAIAWDVTERLPKAFKPETKVKCQHCSGKGVL